MHSIPLRTLSLALSLALCGGHAAAQSSYSGSSGSSATAARSAEARKDDQLSSSDRKFIEEAADGGMFEVQAAKLASSKASSPDVKSFASKLVDEHTKANDELMKLADEKKVPLRATPPHSMRSEVEKLDKLSGKEFDQHFVREVGIKDHEKDIKKFEKASQEAKDPQLKAWVDKTLPHLREHLALAQKLPQGGKDKAAATGNSKTGG